MFDKVSRLPTKEIHLLFSFILFRFCYKIQIIYISSVSQGFTFLISASFHLNKKQKTEPASELRAAHTVDSAAQRSLFTAYTTHSDEHFFCYQGSSVRRHSGTTAQLITFPVSMGTRSSHRCDVIHPRRPGHFSVVFRFKHTSVKYKNNT